MPNRLINETSPYLLQHANNPVNWYPWGEEAFEKARRENKPVFLSIGYAACHWCHVMEHESFEDPETAQIMNEGYVSIKVDREERPDLDSIYMTAVQALTGSGGWPMSVFLTPDGQPFYGGTYFPPVQRYGMPSFKNLLNGIRETWDEKPEDVYKTAKDVTDHVAQASQWIPGKGQRVNEVILKATVNELVQNYDWKNGAWGQAPLFPQPMTIEFLLQQAARGDLKAQKVAVDTLQAMGRGGLYDQVGGGFHRYSTDARWLVPHFEKMLYDNGQLALAYLHSFLVTGDEIFREIATGTLDFILREMTDPQGGFYSSLDADSEGVEGKYYLWSMNEIQSILSNGDEYDLFQKAYGLTEKGNFEGKTILQRKQKDEELGKELNLPQADIRQRFANAHRKLFEARQNRVRPATDDKVLVSWNALALRAFSEAARSLGRQDYLEAARKNADFLLKNLYQNGRLLRAWREGKARHNGYLEDYAALIIALLALYQSDPNPRWFSEAARLGEEMITSFQDENGGFYNTRTDQGKLLIRPKDFQDNATPSGNALAALALLLLDSYAERGDWRDLAESLLGSVQQIATSYPSAFAFWLQGMDFAVGPVQQVAIVYPDQGSERLAEYTNYLWHTYRPRLVAAIAPYPPAEGSPALLHDRPLRQDRTTIYVCQGFVCNLPVTHLEELKQQVKS